MMMARLIGGLALAVLATGCTTYFVSVPAEKGKAYVIRNRPIVGQDMLHCDATGGRPVCVVQQER